LPPKSSIQPAPVLSQPVTSFQVELLPVDEVYRSAGIANPRRGYGIAKVIEMIQSEHIRALAPELKRAAVLMALHAAGVSIGEVITDAKARQETLSAYEIERKKLIEAEWQRKAEENVQIEAELELVKTQYQARMKRNLEAVEREKASFAAWLEKKQQECKSMSDAVDLCLQNTAADAAPATPQAAAATATT
jgi:hypothetical protein